MVTSWIVLNAANAALIAWRHEIEDPSRYLQRFHDLGTQVFDPLLAADAPMPIHERFPFYDLAYTAALLGSQPNAKLVEVLDSGRQEASIDPGLDYSVAYSLGGRSNTLGVDLPSDPPTPRQKLFHETYLAYSRLLDGDAAALQDAERNFEFRASDSYFSGGLDTDGGGVENSHTVDYRLAAILKSRGIQNPTIHSLP